jgi:hypothetical protein
MAITLDGITFSGDMAGQKALHEHREKYYTRVVTGYRDAYERKYTGAPKAGGQGWVQEKVQVPTYGYIRNQKPLPSATPKPAAKPAAKPKAKAPTTPTNTYQSQINTLTSQLSTNKSALDKALANLATTKSSYEDLVKNLKIDFGNQFKTLQSNYATETQKLIDAHGLQISGLKDDFATQFAAQAADFKTKFEGQEASFVERLAKQQRGFDTSMANQAIAGRAANLQIGSNQTSAPQQGGTGGFRRRALQFNTPAYAGLSINSGNINI